MNELNLPQQPRLCVKVAIEAQGIIDSLPDFEKNCLYIGLEKSRWGDKGTDPRLIFIKLDQRKLRVNIQFDHPWLLTSDGRQVVYIKQAGFLDTATEKIKHELSLLGKLKWQGKGYFDGCNGWCK
jgi:hypothetical protein